MSYGTYISIVVPAPVTGGEETRHGVGPARRSSFAIARKPHVVDVGIGDRGRLARPRGGPIDVKFQPVTGGPQKKSSGGSSRAAWTSVRMRLARKLPS